MIIQCSSELLDKLNIHNAEESKMSEDEKFPEDFLTWRATCVELNGKELVYLQNSLTYYPIVLYGLESDDYSNFSELIKRALEEALQIEGIHEDVIQTYMNEASELTYEKLAADYPRTDIVNENTLSFINKFLNEAEKTQKYVSLAAGRLHYKDEDEAQSLYPFIALQEHLIRLYDSVHDEPVDDIIDVDHYVLKIQLDLASHAIWRKVSVPATFSFKYLHDIIQIVFDWQDYHMHQFFMKTKDNKPLVIVQNQGESQQEAPFPSSVERIDERFVSLQDVMTKDETIRYEYDFGDSWEHLITLEKVERKNELHPFFINGKGVRPPEDIGGESGFEHYLEVMRDETHPEYLALKLQTEEGEEREQTKQQVNRRLQSVLSPAGYLKFII